MKKLLLLCLICCLLLVGCNKTGESNGSQKTEVTEDSNKNQVLSCTKNTESTVNFSTEMIYYFENDNVVKLGVKYVYDLSKYNDQQKAVFKGVCETDSIKDTLGMVDCREQLVGDDYVVEGYAEKLLSKASGTLRENQESYIKDGWDCTVK